MQGSLLQTFTGLKDILQDILYPPVCEHCQKIIEKQTDIPLLCEKCLGLLSEMPADAAKADILDRIQPNFIDHIRIAFQFNDVIRMLLHAIKYQQMPNLGFRVGKHIAQKFPEIRSNLQDKLILPVPLHPIRKKEREYNQSLQIARGLFFEHPDALQENLLIRAKYTSTQTKLTRVKRQNNVRNAFAITNPQLLPEARVVLVDDVITTGSTMNECAKLLKKSGAAEVTAIAIASPVNEV